MIQLFPNSYDKFICPNCRHQHSKLEKIVFQGIHLLADLHCPACDFRFYHDFPLGQAITTPVIIDKKNTTLLSPVDRPWFTGPLLNSLQSPSSGKVSVEKKTNRTIAPNDTVIFFNCLDAWYGHVLLKLFNLQFYHENYPAFKKIILLPKGFDWMVPDYADEIWIADLQLNQIKQYFLDLEDFVIKELKKYTAVYHSFGYSHPELQNIKVKDFFKTEPFAISRFTDAPATITFIYREDRLWIHPILNRMYTAINNRKLKFANNFFIHCQNRKINRLAKQLKRSGSNVQFIVCGLGKKGKLNAAIIDKRATAITEEQELEWCGIYSKSHIVIGIHGSNMLIPSSLAAAWIEILPDDRIGNITQDLFCRYAYSNMVFLGRFASEYDPLKRVVALVKGLLQDYVAFQAQKPHIYHITD